MADFNSRNEATEEALVTGLTSISGLTGSSYVTAVQAIVADLMLDRETAQNDVVFINYLVEKYDLKDTYTVPQWDDIERKGINSDYVSKP
jgi:hypothetical protein